MAQQLINIGAAPNDGTGDSLRAGGQKINANFTEVYGMYSSNTGSIETLNSQVSTLNTSTAAHSSDTAKHAHAIAITIDGGGSDLSTGVSGYVTCPFAGSIASVYLVATSAGNVVVDIWKSAGSVPIVANSICPTDKPTLASNQYRAITSLTNWVTNVSAGDVFGFNVDSVSGIQQLTITLRIV